MKCAPTYVRVVGRPNYNYKIVNASNGPQSYTIGSLVRGNFYHVRVSSLTDRGMGLHLNSIPESLAPITTPGLSNAVTFALRTGSSLDVAYDENADAGGS